jgi:hypothetical protein
MMPSPTGSAENPRRPALASALLSAATLLGAWLLFQVQPMVAKRLVPWFGGGTAVWTTVMVFFQAALFAGYLYAHALCIRFSAQRQITFHAALLAGAVALLAVVSVVPTDEWQPVADCRPALHILLALCACVGLPYVLLSATAPLVQSWFARANPGVAPYRLYALSNFGSLAALATYPFFVEPNLGVARQGVAWSVLFTVFAALCAGSGYLALRAAPNANGVTVSPAEGRPSVEVSPDRRRPLEQFFWLALPACASVALLAITAYLCQDVASIPLLWIAPMVVYLLTFILTFESDRWYRRWPWFAALAVLSFAAVFAWFGNESFSFVTQLAIHLALLLSLGMVCHGELAYMRPPASRLTAFYLSIAGGGALGGVLVAVVAPLAFADFYELPLSILAAWVLALAAIVTDRSSKFYDGGAFAPLVGMIALLIALALAMGAYEARKRSHSIAVARNFYGALKVREIGGDRPDVAYLKLNNGRISHGVQFLLPDNRRFPSQYYHAGTGVGQLLGAQPAAPRRVGVVGLGVGTLAAYAESGDSFRFYEINPQVIEFADKYFTFLADARARGAEMTMVLGDARLMLEREPPQNFDVLALDAFTSDAIPTHLLTVEAFEIYVRHLREPDGVLAVHVSNRYMDLDRVVRATAARVKLEGRLVPAPTDGSPAGSSSLWALLYRPGAAISENDLGIPLDAAPTGPAVLWTDDDNNIVRILKSD